MRKRTQHSVIDTVTDFIIKKNFLYLIPGIVWIFFNLFFLPFQIGTEVMHRPWLVMRGEIPYRDFEWIRNPLDIFLLASSFKVFGFNGLTLRIFVFLMYTSIAITIYFCVRNILKNQALRSFYIYIIMLFPLFMNTQIGEALVGFFIFLSFYMFWKFTSTNYNRFLLLSGVFSGLSLLTKQTSIGILTAIGLTLFLFYFRKSFLKKVFIYILGVSCMYLIFILYLLANNALDDYFYYAIYFNLFIYREIAGRWGLNEGVKMLILFFSLVFPFSFLKLKNFPSVNRFLIILIMICMIPTLLPSFWSYRLNTVLPIFSIIASVVLSKVYDLIKQRDRSIITTFSAVMILIFLYIFIYFFNQYKSFIKNYGVSWSPFIYDYSQKEIKAGKWLNHNTDPGQTIFNTASNIIMVFSERDHHNRYIDGLPWVYYPYDETFKEITKVPPRIVIWDKNLPSNWPELKNWKFIPFLNKNYILKKSFGEIEIYFLKKNVI